MFENIYFFLSSCCIILLFFTILGFEILLEILSLNFSIYLSSFCNDSWFLIIESMFLLFTFSSKLCSNSTLSKVFAYVCWILSNNYLYSLMSISLKVVICNYNIFCVIKIYKLCHFHT